MPEVLNKSPVTSLPNILPDIQGARPFAPTAGPMFSALYS